MREIVRHTPGRLFVAVLLLSVAAMLYIPAHFDSQRLFFGWMPLSFLSGLVFLTVWLVAYAVYFFAFWPYRK